MSKLKTSIIEKIDNKLPEPTNFKSIKKRLTYTWVAPKYIWAKPWLKISCGLASVLIIVLSLVAFFKNNMIGEPIVLDNVKEMKLMSWDDNVYCLGKDIYIDYPMLTTCCNIEDKLHFSDTYWEVFNGDEQIDKTNIPISFGINTFTIYEKSIGDDIRIYNLNILVGRDVENIGINQVHKFTKINTKNLKEQIVTFTNYKEFEKTIIENELDFELLQKYNDSYFINNDLLLIIGKNDLSELTYQSNNDILNVTLVGEATSELTGYLVTLNELPDVDSLNVELFNFEEE